MEIVVLDENGEPLPSAKVQIAMTGKEVPLKLDAQGKCGLDLPADADVSLHITVRAAHYVPVEVHWYGEELPSELIVRLEKGLPMGGVVQDRRGEPIAGVEVAALQVSSRVGHAGEIVPVISGQIATTNAEGNWQTDIATREPFDLRIQLKHPDFFSDPGFGKRRLSSTALNSLDHVEILEDLLPPQGIVTDTHGKAVHQAKLHLVFADDKLVVENGQAMQNASRVSVVTDKNGRYEFPIQKQEFSLVCLAKEGWATATPIRFAKNEPVDIRLKEWAQLEGSLSPGNQAIADKEVLLQVFPESNSSYQFVEWNYSTTTDHEGHFAWDRVIAGPTVLGRALVWCSDSETPKSEISVEAQATLDAGRTTRIQINRQGATVSGQIKAIVDGAVSLPISCGMVKLEKESSMAHMLKDVLGSWGKALDLGDSLKLPGTNLPPLSYVGTVNREGSFQLKDVPSGNYQLQVKVQSKRNQHVESQWFHGAKEEAITVPPTAEKQVNLGALEIVVSEMEVE